MKPLFLVSALLPLFATACVAQPAAQAPDLVPVVAPNAVPVAATNKPLRTVETVPWRSTKWREEPVRTLDDLPGFAVAPLDENIGRFGGLKSQVMTKTGFFHVEKSASGPSAQRRDVWVRRAAVLMTSVGTAAAGASSATTAGADFCWI